MGVDLENTILIIDEAHNLPDRIRSGLERKIHERVLQRALAEAQEYKEALENKEKKLDIPESNQLKEAKILETQISALRDCKGLKDWFEEKRNENNDTKGDDLKVDTQDFLDVISDGLEGVLHEDNDDLIQRVEKMITRLLSVVVEEDEDLDEEERNECITLGEFLEICIRYRASPALALVLDEELDVPRITSHLLDPSVVGRPIFEQCSGSILMSGTLYPPQMYSEILGIPGGPSNLQEYDSGFPLGNRPILIANDVTNKILRERR